MDSIIFQQYIWCPCLPHLLLITHTVFTSCALFYGLYMHFWYFFCCIVVHLSTVCTKMIIINFIIIIIVTHLSMLVLIRWVSHISAPAIILYLITQRNLVSLLAVAPCVATLMVFYLSICCHPLSLGTHKNIEKSFNYFVVYIVILVLLFYSKMPFYHQPIDSIDWMYFILPPARKMLLIWQN